MASSKENIFNVQQINFKEEKPKTDLEPKCSKILECTDKYDPLLFCRTCANVDSCLVPIFKEEGLDYNLNSKIEKYLPIQVSQNDGLPDHLCYHCASTLIAWDTLIVGCVKAEKKLNLLKDSIRNKYNEKNTEIGEGIISDNIDSDDEPLIKKNNKNSNELKTSFIKRSYEDKDVSKNKNCNDPSLELLKSNLGRFENEPDLSFSTYQCQFNIHVPFINKILNLNIGDSFCCENCTIVERLKLFLTKLKVNFLKEKETIQFIKDSDETLQQKKSKISTNVKSLKKYICKKCQEVFPTKLSLKNHMKTHREIKKFSCEICNKNFGHRFNLSRHVKVIHEGVRNHVCSDCGKRYRSHGEMEDHRNIHKVQNKIICEECGRIFLTKASFYPHRKFHRMSKTKTVLAKYSCDACKKKFTTKKSRDQHMLIHTGEKPIICAVCGKNFRTKANFSQHSKVHSKIRPFGCDHCGKAFARKDHLKIHVRCHTGEKPFICNFCGRGFAQMNDMKKHSKLHIKS